MVPRVQPLTIFIFHVQQDRGCSSSLAEPSHALLPELHKIASMPQQPLLPKLLCLSVITGENTVDISKHWVFWTFVLLCWLYTVYVSMCVSITVSPLKLRQMDVVPFPSFTSSHRSYLRVLNNFIIWVFSVWIGKHKRQQPLCWF